MKNTRRFIARMSWAITLILIPSVVMSQTLFCDSRERGHTTLGATTGTLEARHDRFCAASPGDILLPMVGGFAAGSVDVLVRNGLVISRWADGSVASYASQTMGSDDCTNFPKQLVVAFSKPVADVAISVFGARKATDNRGHTVTLNPPLDGPSGSNPGYPQRYAGAFFPGEGITSITISDPFIYTVPGYATGAFNIAAADLSFAEGSIYQKCSCAKTTFARPQPEAITGVNGWSMTADVTDDDGLVLREVRLGQRYMAESISVPYYTLETSALANRRGELKPDSSDGSMRSRLVDYYVKSDDVKLVIEATYLVDQIPATSQSCLQITQRYEFYKEGVLPCEPSGTIECSNFKAMVKYKFLGRNGETLSSINVPQRTRYKVNNYAANTVSIFRDCDGQLDCIRTPGVVFKSKQNPLFAEHEARVITNGQNAGSWDNVHQTYQGYVDEPASLSLILRRGIFGGCPECVHSHWRWGSSIGEGFEFLTGIDPLKFNNFQVYIPNGSTQDFDFAVVKHKPGEEDPNDYRELVSQEPIRHRPDGQEWREQIYNNSAPDETVTWYSATGRQAQDTFFILPGFFGEAELDVTAAVTRDASNPANASAASPSREGRASALSDSNAQDGPASVRFANQFVGGPTTFTDVDPNTVAPLPAGYAAYNNVGYGITTEALISGPLVAAFDIPSVNDPAVFEKVRILHAEADPGDPYNVIWVDRTILSPDAPAPDFTGKSVSARVDFLGDFVIAIQTQPPPINSSVADVALSMTDAPDPINAASNLIYTLSVTNSGPQAATGVVLTDGLPPNVDVVSITPSQGSCTEQDGNVICKLDVLNAGAVATITLVAKPGEDGLRFPPEGVAISNTAFVRANENDNVGTNNTATETTTLFPDTNQTPAVSITTPAVGSLFAGPANISITASASDPDGTVSGVEFFDNGVSIGTGTATGSQQYEFAWGNVAFGGHTIIAQVTDNLGKQKASSPVQVYVNGSASVSIRSPVAGLVFNPPVSLTVTANASQNGGSISKVDFYANGSPIGTGTLTGVAQYGVNWSNAPSGDYSFTAVATNSAGVTTMSAPVTIRINEPPVVNLNAPASGAVFNTPATITLSANASDSEGAVSHVNFHANGSLIGRSTKIGSNLFSVTWSNMPAGTYSVTAAATDDADGTTTSAPITVRVNAPPAVSIISPASGTRYTAPASVTLTANTADNDGSVTRVDFFANGLKVGSVAPTAPGQLNFAWNNVGIGNYTVWAVATDNNGATKQSGGITVFVSSPALLVVGSATLNGGDSWVKTRLEGLGYQVTVKDGTSAATADANGKAVVVISSTVSPTAVGTKFRAVAVPVILWESGLFFNMGMTTKTSSNFGTTASQTQVRITNPTHPLAGGLAGTVTAVSAAGTFDWGKPNANASAVGTLAGDTSRSVIFGYDGGAAMPGLAAPARRVGLFMHDNTGPSLTASGAALFDAAVRWAGGLASLSAGVSVPAPGGSVGLTAEGFAHWAHREWAVRIASIMREG